MKIISILLKSAREQLRHYWILILTVSMAPFFVFIYFLISEASKPHYDLLILNHDKGTVRNGTTISYGEKLYSDFTRFLRDVGGVPFYIKQATEAEKAMHELRLKKADALVIIPEDFSDKIAKKIDPNDTGHVSLVFIGDLTNYNYILTAIWANDFISHFYYRETSRVNPLKFQEIPLGESGNMDDFNIYIPGILILSVIMLMFSASIAFITEVENKTILRLKLSRLTTFEFLTGVSLVQIAVGLISAILTILIAIALGFSFQGNIFTILLIIVLTSISIIAFSLIIAAITKSVTEILVIGNFPLFLFMFFTGSAFPMTGAPLFTLWGYTFTLQGLMSPTHAVSAIQKIITYKMTLEDIRPELFWLSALSVLYFLIGLWAFNRRHMRVR